MQKKEKKQKKFINKLTRKYRLVFLRDKTFQEVGYIRVSRMNIISVIGTIFVVVVALTYITIAYTSLKEFIPGYPDVYKRQS